MKLLLVAASSMIILALAEKQGEPADPSKEEYMTAKEIKEMQRQLTEEKLEWFFTLSVLAMKGEAEFRVPNGRYSKEEARCLRDASVTTAKTLGDAFTGKKGPLEQELKSGHPIKKSEFLKELHSADESLHKFYKFWMQKIIVRMESKCKDEVLKKGKA